MGLYDFPHICKTLRDFDAHLASVITREDSARELRPCFLRASGIWESLEATPPIEGKAPEEARQPESREDLAADFAAFKELPPEEQRNGKA